MENIFYVNRLLINISLKKDRTWTILSICIVFYLIFSM